MVSLTIAVTTNGALAVVEPAVSCSPEGLDWKVRFTVRGWRVTLAVPVNPPESLAVRRISSDDG
jgi:outer membrane biosynthesis protein TonB